MNKHKYLPHIDGLRAISVILVILFHFMIGPFSGGYIGVDVFFTISGFLIIGSIVSQLEAGKFSALDFWQRRIRRLIPAILATLFLCLAAGFLIMNPNGFSSLAKQSIFALFSLINFTLLGKVDYFDQSSPDEPLLHFWSLAVEEQFYFLFPIIALSLFFMLRKNENYKAVMIGILILLSIISVTVAESLIKSGQNLMAYYMMPTRFSQLAMGGVLAISLQYKRFETFLNWIPQTIHALITMSGIVAIGYVATRFTVNTSFPGLNSTLPTYGALAVLMSGGRNYLKPALENPVAAYIGKLSYSLYLVHWPVWAFLAYYLNRHPEGVEVVGALLTSFGLSMFIYHFIEKPFRFGTAFKGRSMYKFLIPGIAAMIFCTGTIVKLQGVPERLPSDRMEFVKDAKNYHKVNFGGRNYNGDQNELGDPNAKASFLLIGDSKARQFAFGLDKYLKERHQKAILISADGCPMIESLIRYVDGKPLKKCLDRIQQVIKFANTTTLPIISIRSWSYAGPLYYKGQPFSIKDKGSPEIYANLHVRFHQQLLSTGKTKRQIYMIGSNQGFRNSSSITDCLTRPSWIGLYCLKSNNFNAKDYELPEVEKIIQKESAKNSGITYIPMIDIFCETGVCSQFSSNGDVMFSDPNHLSKIGSEALSRKLLNYTILSTSLEAPAIETHKVQVELPQNIDTNHVQSIVDYAAYLHASSKTARPKLIEEIGTLISQRSVRRNLVNALWDGDKEIVRDREISAELAESFAQRFEDPSSIYRIGLAYYSGKGKDQNLSKSLKFMEHPSQSENHVLLLRRATIYLNESSKYYNPEKGIALLKQANALNVKGADSLLMKITK